MPSVYKTSIIICMILLALLIDQHLAGTCCEGDKSCSGCWMCEGSKLRICWDLATPMPSKCEAIKDLQQKAACYCKAYAAIAKCWSAGYCCSEYAPTLAAATDLCNLQTYPAHMISGWQLTEAVKEAARVTDGIFHNDSGVDVPKCQSHIKPYTGSAVATGTAQANIPSYRSYKSIEEHHDTPTLKPQYGSTTTKPKYYNAKFVAHKPSYQRYDLKAHKHYKKGLKENRGPRKEGDENKISKRETRTSSDMSTAQIKEARLSKRHMNCGKAFNNVVYPDSIPRTVQKAFDEI